MASSRAADAPVGPDRTALPEWVIFSCGRRRYGLPLARVREIVTPRAVTRLPGCGPDVLGLMGLRGRIVTVYDLGLVLGDVSAATNAEHRLLLIEQGTRIVAGAVDGVVAVASAEAAVRGAAVSGEEDAVVGEGHWGGEPFAMLDADRMLNRLLV